METVTKSQLDELRASTDQLIAVDFFADWCGPCKVFGKTLSALEEEFFGANIKFVKVNTEDEDDLVEEFSIRNLPTFILIRGTETLERTTGNLPAGDIRSLIEKHLN